MHKVINSDDYSNVRQPTGVVILPKEKKITRMMTKSLIGLLFHPEIIRHQPKPVFYIEPAGYLAHLLLL